MFSRDFSTAEFLKILFFFCMYSWDTVRLGASCLYTDEIAASQQCIFHFLSGLLFVFTLSLRLQIRIELEFPALMLQKMNEQTNSITKVTKLSGKAEAGKC